MLYLYAVLGEPAAGGPLTGLARERVDIVRAHGLSVAVGELAAPPAVAAGSLRGHDAAVRALAARSAAILPMRFGQTVADLEALEECVRRARPRLCELLELVEGCQQFTLRVFDRGEGARAGAVSGSASAGSAGAQGPAPERHASEEARRAGPATSSPGTAYLRERLAARAREHEPPAEVRELLEQLAPLVRAQRVERGRSGALLASIHQLVQATELGAWQARFAAGRRAQPELRVGASGPWPPYAFAQGMEDA